jgi:hypothetical protein
MGRYFLAALFLCQKPIGGDEINDQHIELIRQWRQMAKRERGGGAYWICFKHTPQLAAPEEGTCLGQNRTAKCTVSQKQLDRLHGAQHDQVAKKWMGGGDKGPDCLANNA